MVHETKQVLVRGRSSVAERAETERDVCRTILKKVAKFAHYSEQVLLSKQIRIKC
jgi:hypothetical protein